MISSFSNQERSASMGEDIREVDPSLHASQSSSNPSFIDVLPESGSGVPGGPMVQFLRGSLQLFWHM